MVIDGGVMKNGEVYESLSLIQACEFSFKKNSDFIWILMLVLFS